MRDYNIKINQRLLISNAVLIGLMRQNVEVHSLIIKLH